MFTKTFFLYILIYFRYAIPQILSLTLCYRVISKSIKTHLCNKSFKMLTYDSCMPFHRNSREFLKNLGSRSFTSQKDMCSNILDPKPNFTIYSYTVYYIDPYMNCTQTKVPKFYQTKDWYILPHQCGRVNKRSGEGLGGS